MEPVNRKCPNGKGFWHFLRYNPPALLQCWFQHMIEPSEAFWQNMAWNSPYFESWLSSQNHDDLE